MRGCVCVCVCDPRGEESSNFLRTESEREQRKIETRHGNCAERGEREGGWKRLVVVVVVVWAEWGRYSNSGRVVRS